MLHLKGLENQKQIKPEIIIKKEIIKVRKQINQIQTKKKMERKQSQFFEMINRIDKSLAKLNKRYRERPDFIKLKLKIDIIIDSSEIQTFIRKYLNKFCHWKICKKYSNIWVLLTKIESR
jgi:hypothetical protein